MLVYVAGPLRPKGEQTLEGNLKIAKDIAYELWTKGFAVICPHANTILNDEAMDFKETSGVCWLKGDFEMISRCDAVVVCPDYYLSKGTIEEIAYANKRDIPVYYYPNIPQISTTETKYPKQCEIFIDTIMKMYHIYLSKNADYSPANISGTEKFDTVMRVWDSITRLMKLSGFNLQVETAAFTKPHDLKNELVNDALDDLSVYGIIAQLLRRELWNH